MANADFRKNRTALPAVLTRAATANKSSRSRPCPLTPLQQKLAGLEAKLPAALSTRAAALALSVVVMLAAFLGFGSAKLRSRYNEVRKWYTVGVAADNGYNLNVELTTRMNTAANIITTAGSTLGADSAEAQAAQSALSDLPPVWKPCRTAAKVRHSPRCPYIRAARCTHCIRPTRCWGRGSISSTQSCRSRRRPHEDGAVQGQYGQFNSAATIIGTLKYNDAVYDYQKETGGFPASVLGAIAGVKEVEPFAEKFFAKRMSALVLALVVAQRPCARRPLPPPACRTCPEISVWWMTPTF